MTLGHELKAMVDLNDFGLLAQGFRCYEQLIVMDDMNNSGFYELRPLDAMNNIGLWMIQMIVGIEPMTLNVMNNSKLWII